MRDAVNDPLIRFLWKFAIALWFLAAVVFGLLALGEVVGLWEFDTGLGCEKGDKLCGAG